MKCCHRIECATGPLPVRSTSVQSTTTTSNVAHANATDEAASSNTGSLNGEKAQSIEIDGKIDKAMDLVKVHLLYAVRTEVKQLKEEIDRLNKELNCLKIENCILRRHVPLEVLAVLKLTFI
ncbi:Protein bunched, class 1 [Trichuris trichiura]|uniref:Protein bunched, class 1 n=1 Tax=Trichuris trichiura TaxID=36087 RepID=A0A077YVT4_TRITR|nr:Protein bunched, class 1 [Trichuris trichiura]